MLLVGLRDVARAGLEDAAPDRPCILSGDRRAARALNELLAIAASGPAGNEPPRLGVRRLWRCLESEGRREAPARPSWLTEVHERVRREGATRYGLQRLARGVGVHPVYLARVFRRHYGVTIGVLRRRQRVERALARLRTENTPLAEIALDLGYADQSHFCRELKRETGWTPGRFRGVSAELATAPQPP
jgi:AraC family transcriptional regulator